MGKLKRGRKKLHNAAVKVQKPGQAKQSDKVEIIDMMETETKGSSNLISSLVSQDNDIFKGVNISKKSLTQELPDFDSRSTITSKSLKSLQMKKKEKQKLRHDLWIKKLSGIESARKEAKDRKKKQQTPVVGDIGVLGEALPTLDLLLRGSSGPANSQSTQQKPRSIPKEKKRKKQMLQDIELFQQVFQHPSYQEDPTGTINEHLQNKLKQDDQMDT